MSNFNPLPFTLVYSIFCPYSKPQNRIWKVVISISESNGILEILDGRSRHGTAMDLLVAPQDTIGMTLSWICYKFAENPEAATGGGERSLRSSWRENSIRLQQHPGIHLSRPVDPRVPQVPFSYCYSEGGAKRKLCLGPAARWRRAA